MKKLFTVMILCLCFAALTACGTKDEEEKTITNPDEVYVNIGKNLEEQAGDIIDASQKATYSSYEEVCNDYSDRLNKAYAKFEKELKDEVAAGKDTNELVKSSKEMLKQMSDISQEGIGTMSKMSGIDPTLGDYSTYSGRLNSLYMAYEQNLNSICNGK